MATATTAQNAWSLRSLRQAVADRFGDLTQLTTTGSGSTTTLIDALTVNAGGEHFNGRQLLVTSGTYANTKARVTATNDNGTLTFTPAAGGTIASGVTVDVFNRRGIGFTIGEYDRAINSAIDDAFPLGLIEAVATLSSGDSAIEDLITTITVPVSWYEIYALEWQDDEDVWREIPRATRTNGYGWKARPDGKLEVMGLPQDDTEEATLRLRGYKRQDRLSAASNATDIAEECLLPKEWLVARAAYHLALGAIMRGQEYGALAQQFGREADALRTRLRTVRKSNSERVRSF